MPAADDMAMKVEKSLEGLERALADALEKGGELVQQLMTDSDGSSRLGIHQDFNALQRDASVILSEGVWEIRQASEAASLAQHREVDEAREALGRRERQMEQGLSQARTALNTKAKLAGDAMYQDLLQKAQADAALQAKTEVETAKARAKKLEGQVSELQREVEAARAALEVRAAEVEAAREQAARGKEGLVRMVGDLRRELEQERVEADNRVRPLLDAARAEGQAEGEATADAKVEEAVKAQQEAFNKTIASRINLEMFSLKQEQRAEVEELKKAMAALQTKEAAASRRADRAALQGKLLWHTLERGGEAGISLAASAHDRMQRTKSSAGIPDGMSDTLAAALGAEGARGGWGGLPGSGRASDAGSAAPSRRASDTEFTGGSGLAAAGSAGGVPFGVSREIRTGLASDPSAAGSAPQPRRLMRSVTEPSIHGSRDRAFPQPPSPASPLAPSEFEFPRVTGALRRPSGHSLPLASDDEASSSSPGDTVRGGQAFAQSQGLGPARAARASDGGESLGSPTSVSTSSDTFSVVVLSPQHAALGAGPAAGGGARLEPIRDTDLSSSATALLPPPGAASRAAPDRPAHHQPPPAAGARTDADAEPARAAASAAATASSVPRGPRGRGLPGSVNPMARRSSMPELTVTVSSSSSYRADAASPSPAAGGSPPGGGPRSVVGGVTEVRALPSKAFPLPSPSPTPTRPTHHHHHHQVPARASAGFPGGGGGRGGGGSIGHIRATTSPTRARSVTPSPTAAHGGDYIPHARSSSSIGMAGELDAGALPWPDRGPQRPRTMQSRRRSVEPLIHPHVRVAQRPAPMAARPSAIKT